MRIGVTSDIHTDISPANSQIISHLVNAINSAELDVFVICGDVSPNISKFYDTLSAFRDLNCKKLFIAGNHDIWILNQSDNINSSQKYSLITKFCEEHGFHHLGDSPIIFENIGFCGTIGWYDYTFKSHTFKISDRDYTTKIFNGSVWNDVNFARWNETDIEISGKFEHDLQKQIDSIRDRVSQIIVATHHVPFRDCVLYRNELTWDFFSAFMGSAGLGEICLKEPLVTHALFGHTHTEFYKEIKAQNSSGLTQKVLAICSPIGYLTETPKDLKEYAKKRLKIIEL
jgi:putative phosphoesterase